MHIIQPFLFISYAQWDHDVVSELCAVLTRGGYGRWLDIEQISIGERLGLELNAAIDRAALFVACLTPHYARKAAEDGYIRQELTHALEIADRLARDSKGSPFVLPVELIHCEVPAMLRERDLLRGEIRSVEGIERVLSSVHKALQQRGLIGITVVAEEGPEAGKIWHLVGPIIHIGRAPKSDIAISDPVASAEHARIEIRKQAVFLHHLSASGRTVLAGTRTIVFDAGRMGSARLADGDRLHVGNSILSFSLAAVDFRQLAITTTRRQ